MGFIKATKNYLISVFLEIKKISWPKKQSVKNNTTVVVVLSLTMAFVLALMDLSLSQVLKFILIL